MAEVESLIAEQLRSLDLSLAKKGLVNILCWGYAQIGYWEERKNNFWNNVFDEKIRKFQALVTENTVPTMKKIKDIGLPEYSGMSFISKVLMFLNPNSYCVLDQQIAKLRNPACTKSLNQLVFREKATQIRVTRHNEVVYDRWRNECSEISQSYFNNQYRVVDIERGFFTLIQDGHLREAQEIYNDA